MSYKQRKQREFLSIISKQVYLTLSSPSFNLVVLKNRKFLLLLLYFIENGNSSKEEFDKTSQKCQTNLEDALAILNVHL